MSTPEREARRLRIRGRVQGVGFRPFVCRLARSLQLTGWVGNDDEGVLIHIEGTLSSLQAFRENLERQHPAPAQIDAVAEEVAHPDGSSTFAVRSFATTSPQSIQTRVPADRAICAACCQEIMTPGDHRHRHAFASCTACGPRYSILCRMPYERSHTSMGTFTMCRRCADEYSETKNRRFHAEPIACPECGPRLDDAQIVAAAAETLRAGKIVAFKGLGGYQLLVRADDNAAVERLRRRKLRPAKPFAVMVRSLEDAARYAHVSPREGELLQSPENPIVLLRAKEQLAAAVAPDVPTIGLFLPTTPLHVLLLSLLDFPVIATSGNQSEEPIVIDERQRGSLGSIADAFLEHDRPIVRRVDDSVARVIDKQSMMIRLARGYAPYSLPALERWALASDVSIPPMLAVGGQQKGTVALWTGTQAILSAHLGDMDHPESRRVFAETVDDLAHLYRCEPQVLVGDLHPDYFTTRWAQDAGKPFLQVQHHHAHAVACMVEYDLLEREVAAIIWDGTGFGTDGTIWGGEILRASMHDFQRIAALESFALPGGAAAIREPNRIALSVLTDSLGFDAIPDWLFERLGFGKKEAHRLVMMMERRVNSPLTSSVGRLFDAVAALLLGIRAVSYEGEAAIRLEAAAARGLDTGSLPDAVGMRRGDWRRLIRGLAGDLESGITSTACAGRFHRALADWGAACVADMPIGDVVLGGGCFQNALLTMLTRAAIVKQGKAVHVPSSIPPNDGGLAVGQLAIGMARWRRRPEES